MQVTWHHAPGHAKIWTDDTFVLATVHQTVNSGNDIADANRALTDAKTMAAAWVMRDALYATLRLLRDPDADSFDAAKIETQVREAILAAGGTLEV